MKIQYEQLLPSPAAATYSEQDIESISLIPYDEPSVWNDYGACKKADLALVDSTKPQDQERFKKEFCGSCVVRSQCGEYALQNQENHGVWGGMTKEERWSILARRALRGIR